jgi:hypothetical protein
MREARILIEIETMTSESSPFTARAIDGRHRTYRVITRTGATGMLTLDGAGVPGADAWISDEPADTASLAAGMA